jgi:hypothetical protein
MVELRGRIFNTISRFSKSHNAMSEVKKESGLTILFPASTRWNTLEIAYRRVVKIYKPINSAAHNHGFPMISREDYETLEEILEILTPVAKFTEKLQRENSPTISLLLPGLLSLIELLRSVHKQRRLADSLVNNIKGRFSHVIESGMIGEDPIYLCSAILDASVIETLIGKRPYAIEDSRIVLRSMIQNLNIYSLTVENVGRPDPESLSSDSSDDGLFGFRVSSTGESHAEQRDDLDHEIAIYLDFVKNPSNTKKQTASEFWKINANDYPRIAKLFKAVSPIPATSASPERMFSQMTLHSSGHKGNSTAHTIRRKVLMVFNQGLIEL